jgi:hypothetical protein
MSHLKDRDMSGMEVYALLQGEDLVITNVKKISVSLINQHMTFNKFTHEKSKELTYESK